MTSSNLLAAVVGATVLGFTTISKAADPDLAVCRAIGDGAKRLVCYDDLAAKRGSAPKSSATAGPGQWSVQETGSPVDDSKTVVVTLEAMSPIKGTLGQAVVPTMVLRCQQNHTEAYINFDVFLGTEQIAVLTRYDSAPAATTTWTTSTDHKAAFMPSPVAAIHSMKASSKLLVQLTPYSESPVMTTFDLTGADQATKGIRDTCHRK